MALIRWGREHDPISQYDRLQREMGQLMSAFGPWRRPELSRGYRQSVYPALNVYNDGECFIVRAEVPGVDPKALDIEVTGETLTIKGERSLPEKPEGTSYHRRERDFGQFSRSLTLPDRVNSNKVSASCEHGILEIRLPHAEEAKARKIAVKNS